MMLSILTILAMQLADKPNYNCTSPETERVAAACEYLKKMEGFKILTVDDVAFGTIDQMFLLKTIARDCGLLNQVDPVDEKNAYFRIVNASSETKSCLVEWIRKNKPTLEWTVEKQKELERFVE
jgi:hypothetical protein